MRLATRAARDDVAQKRIVTAIEVLTERFDLDAELMQGRMRRSDAATRAMLQREQIADLLEAVIEATEPDQESGDQGSGIGDLVDLKPEIVDALIEAGYDSPDAIRRATLSNLMKVPGIGKKTAQKLVGE